MAIKLLDSGSSKTNSGSSKTNSSGDSSTFKDPKKELREASGAASGATGSEIMASGGDPISGAISITGSGTAGSGGPTNSTVNRLVESGTTDAPSDIVTKYQGGNDPNAGHTTPKTARDSAKKNIASSTRTGGAGTKQSKLDPTDKEPTPTDKVKDEASNATNTIGSGKLVEKTSISVIAAVAAAYILGNK